MGGCSTLAHAVILHPVLERGVNGCVVVVTSLVEVDAFDGEFDLLSARNGRRNAG